MPEPAGAGGLLVGDVPESPVVGEAGQLVGDRLLADHLVKRHVLDRRRGLPDQVPEDVPVGVGEGAVRAGDAHHTQALGGAADRVKGRGERVDPVLGDLHQLVRLSGLELGAQDRVGQWPRRCAGRHLGPTQARQGDQAVLGAAGGYRGLGNDLQQPVAVEARGERLADASHRTVDLHLLASQLIHLRDQPVAHLVELGGKPGHLVVFVAAHRDLLAEVAAADPLRRLEHRLDLARERRLMLSTNTSAIRKTPTRIAAISGLEASTSPSSTGPNSATRCPSSSGRSPVSTRCSLPSARHVRGLVLRDIDALAARRSPTADPST